MGFDYWALAPHIKDVEFPKTSKLVRVITNSQVESFRFVLGDRIRLYKKEYTNPRINIDCPLINEATRQLFRAKKLILRGVAQHTVAAWDDEGCALLVAVHAFVPEKVDPYFVLGLLNSSLFNWLHRIRFYSARIPKGSLRYPVSFWETLPIRMGHKDESDRIARLAKKMSQKSDPVTQHDLASLDSSVFQLYGVSQREFANLNH
jgi:hypothetical protein